ncbi:sirohydrochlorin cobaltochelatase [Clostridium massiliamazoniense]|uniref:sirohydrochlorin cobaltochelatase n=1 Tax=Clostridium massiliamazoniense TaxID=1347366 RepID=UPI0006D7BD89|nr:sirohydrochlorin cobaltochelatase [Clostridium massiliamazoniense]
MKKAILVTSFGSSDIDAVDKSISIIEKEIALEFKDYDVVRAFTAHRIIKKIKAQSGEVIKTPEEALEELKNLGYEEVIIQPLHIIAGEEYDYIKKVFNDNKNNFENLLLGRPIFYYGGANGTPNDYIEFINAVEDEILKDDKAVVLFGHGTAHPANSAYGCLQSILNYKGYDNVFITTVEAYPKFEDVLAILKRKSIKKVKVIPLLLLAGHHAKQDMASNEEGSLKTYLENEGISVEVLINGLGEIKKFRELYILRIKDVIEGTYHMIGETKKYIKN